MKPLIVNGLHMSPDFPTATFERAYAHVNSMVTGSSWEHFSAAWNAISLRFLSLAADERLFLDSINAKDAGRSHQLRFEQERYLFNFFSNGFSAFEAFFTAFLLLGVSSLQRISQ